MPGVKVNISKSGMSTSIGARGMTVNVKRGRKTRVTTGIPGSGISYTQFIGESRNIPGTGISGKTILFGVAIFLIIILALSIH